MSESVPVSATVSINGTRLTTALMDILMSPDIEPGSEPSYQLAKLIYTHHPLGRKMAEGPIAVAQSQRREIIVPGPERLVDCFKETWDKLHCDKYIRQTATMARVYGIASVALVSDQLKPSTPIDPDRLADLDIAFNVLDPLNTSGSLVLSQQPNSPDFLKSAAITVEGQTYHRSRTCVVMNEQPVYIAWSSSAYGFTGRSVYQRALFPLKTFIQSMLTDDMITRKAGLLIAKQKSPGSIINRAMQSLASAKRQLLQQAQTGNVLSIDVDESVETVNMMNLEGPAEFARTNLLKNIATAADMPAKMLENETLVMGFGEGTEDAKNIAHYIESVRADARPLYDFFDAITMRCAWTKELYQSIQRDYPEYRKRTYEDTFQDWKNHFAAPWPSLLIEPESEKVKTDDVKLKGIVAVLQVLVPLVTDAVNKVKVIEWAQDNINESDVLFPVPMLLDFDELMAAAEEQVEFQEQAQEAALLQPQQPGQPGAKPAPGGNVKKMPGATAPAPMSARA